MPEAKTGASAIDKDYKKIADDLNAGFKELSLAAPKQTQALIGFFQSSGAAGVLDKKTKELIATAISIAGHCETCIAHHVEEAHKNGASREEMVETIMMAIHMGGGPSTVYGIQALRAYDQFAG